MQLDDAFPITFHGLRINYDGIASSAEIKCVYSRVISNRTGNSEPVVYTCDCMPKCNQL